MQSSVMEQYAARAKQLREALEQIRGVRAARVIIDDSGDVAEVHLEGSTERKPKPIVRDAESLLCARFGIRVDYRKISLVQLAQKEPEELRRRLQLVSASRGTDEPDQAQVVLASNSDRVRGVASIGDADSDLSTARATAEATLAAVGVAIRGSVPLSVQEVQLVLADGECVCLAVILAMLPGGPQRLSGSSIVTDSVMTAACKAALDAINRRFSTWRVTD